MTTVKQWWIAVRPFSFTVSIMPPILGAIIAAWDGYQFSWAYFGLIVLACLAAHAGSNLMSDYFDYKNHVDREGTYGSSGVLTSGAMKPEAVLFGSIVLLLVAALIGLYFIISLPNGMGLFHLILAGALLAIFYTAPPVALKYVAFGDFAVFLAFGPLMTLGTYCIFAETFSWTPVLFSLPVALLVDAILHGNNIRDVENDKVARIKTVPIILGNEFAKKMYYFLIAGAYISTIVLVVTTKLPYVVLISLVSLPIAIKLMKMVKGREQISNDQFAKIDEMTAQLHLMFGMLFSLSLLAYVLIKG